MINDIKNLKDPEALLESRSLREQYVDKVDVLNEVKELTMLPDNIHASTDIAAEYYEVSKVTLSYVIKVHNDELTSVGMTILKGDKLKRYKEIHILEEKYRRVNSLTLLPRQAVLRLGMLLRDSEVAKAVRFHLLNVDKTTDEDDANVDAPDTVDEVDVLDNEEKRDDTAVNDNVAVWRQPDLIDTVNNVMRYQFETMQQQNELLRQLITGYLR